jgi:hypothetical protein
MLNTREAVDSKLAAYLHHESSLGDLADWAQLAMVEGEFEDAHRYALCGAVARLTSVMCAHLG